MSEMRPQPVGAPGWGAYNAAGILWGEPQGCRCPALALVASRPTLVSASLSLVDRRAQKPPADLLPMSVARGFATALRPRQAHPGAHSCGSGQAISPRERQIGPPLSSDCVAAGCNTLHASLADIGILAVASRLAVLAEGQ